MAVVLNYFFAAPALGRFAPYLERGLITACHTLSIQGTTDDVVTNTRKVLYTTTTNQYD